MVKPRVYIVILNYKKWQDVRDCLESVFRMDYDHFKVIVLDNGSGNQSLERLLEWATSPAVYPDPDNPPFARSLLKKPINYVHLNNEVTDEAIDPDSFPELVFVQNEKNEGFGSGNNRALRFLAKTEGYIWLLNPDMVVAKNTLSELIAFAEVEPAGSIIGSVTKSYARPHGVLFYGGGRINFRTATINMIREIDDIPRLDYISGGSLLITTDHLRQIGLFPEHYFLYWEETDWCYRAKQKGFRMSVCMTAICYDKISTTIGKSFMADYYYTRNGLLFVSTFKKRLINPALLSAGIRMFKRLALGKWQQARGVYKGIGAFLNREGHENK
jgi:GT2 family glycosyltransferase